MEELVCTIEQAGIYSYTHIDNLQKIDSLLKFDFQGFIILASPVERLDRYQKLILEKMNRWFLTYYYNDFVSYDLEKFISSNFDFIIAGDRRKENLETLLKFLYPNYWKKIPLSILKYNNHVITPLIRRILLFIEVSQTDLMSIEYLSRHLYIPEVQIRAEIRKTLDMNYAEFIKKIDRFYQKYQEEYHN